MRKLFAVALTAAEKQRRYRAKHKACAEFRERIRAEKRASYHRHKAASVARSQRWAESNRDRTRTSAKTFYDSHRTTELIRCAEKGRRRTAAKRTNQTEKVNYETIVRESLGICALCDQPVIYEPAHIDHIVPIAKGGTHTQDNLQFTHARCNLAKGAKLLKKVG